MSEDMVSQAKSRHTLPAWQRQALSSRLNYAVTLAQEKCMDNQPANSNSQSQKLSDSIGKTWGKLTTEEKGFYKSSPDKFFAAVETKYSIKEPEAKKIVEKLEAECAAACSASSGNDSSATSGPLPKAANA